MQYDENDYEAGVADCWVGVHAPKLLTWHVLCRVLTVVFLASAVAVLFI